MQQVGLMVWVFSDPHYDVEPWLIGPFPSEDLANSFKNQFLESCALVTLTKITAPNKAVQEMHGLFRGSFQWRKWLSSLKPRRYLRGGL